MKKRFVVTALLLLSVSANSIAANSVAANNITESKNDFNRKHVFIGADPATIKLMSAVVSHIDGKFLQGEPDIQLRHAGKALKQFCLGTGADYPDIVVTTREMNSDEFKRCQTREAGGIIKFKMGYEALVVVADKKAINLELNQRALFKALAQDVPDPKAKQSGVLTQNPYMTWKDINPSMPAKAIKIYGPAEHTRDARSIKILGMEGGCRSWDWIPEMKNIQRSYRLYRAICHATRKDGKYIKADSVDSSFTKKLLADKNSMGLISFNQWQAEKDKLKAYSINDLPPTIATISKGLYPLSRAYYVYIKTSSLKNVRGVSYVMNELINEKTLAAEGYLVEKGMVAMPKKEMQGEIKQALEFTAMTTPRE